jgi:TPR repeat protein
MTLSAILFERCAKENGGCGVGMLMWALALRHGWGCPVDTLKAFGWLQLSIETLLRELHHAKLEKQHYDELHSNEKTPKDLLLAQYLINETNGIKSELLLALYELGQCLMYGWGCPRDKRLVNS